MELKISISEHTYEEIKKNDKILLSKVHELFDAVRNGIPADEADNCKVDEEPFFECILNKEEADIFNSLSNGQKEIVCKLLDNAVKQAEEKDTTNGPVSKKEIDDHVEVCRLMTDYLGRKFDPQEAKFISLYKTIEQNKELLTRLDGAEKEIVKLAIRALL